MNKKGQLIVVSGPSGVGKGTVLKEYLASRDQIAYSVSATTRSPRPILINFITFLLFLSKFRGTLAPVPFQPVDQPFPNCALTCADTERCRRQTEKKPCFFP